MVENENEHSDSSEAPEADAGNPAMADAIRKVLNIGKNTTNTSVVLSKAKVLSKGKKTKNTGNGSLGFEIDKTGDGAGDEEEEKEDVKDEKISLLRIKRKMQKEVVKRGRVKPMPQDRETERPLVKIATRGVVQLFNAVREQQKFISKKIEEVGSSETKRDKVLKSIDKKSFIDVLRGCSETSKTEETKELELKSEDEENDEASWSVLRDDFMMGAKLKDWDKKDEVPEHTATKKPKLKAA